MAGSWRNAGNADRWPRYAESRPRPVSDGIATSKQRGDMADSWWSQRFTDVLESYGLGTRMQRGRRYARLGQVAALDLVAGSLVAEVQGSRSKPYTVLLSTKLPTAKQWAVVDEAISGQVGFVARLLAGEAPAELEQVFAAAGVSLFPKRWSAIKAQCSCPDEANPCKHIAAALYVFADQLDDDPWLLLEWRGRSRDELLGAFVTAPAEDTDPGIAPWWPLAPGPAATEPVPVVVDLPEPADVVLTRLAPLGVEVRGEDVDYLLGPAYEAIQRAQPPQV